MVRDNLNDLFFAMSKCDFLWSDLEWIQRDIILTVYFGVCLHRSMEPLKTMIIKFGTINSLIVLPIFDLFDINKSSLFFYITLFKFHLTHNIKCSLESICDYYKIITKFLNSIVHVYGVIVVIAAVWIYMVCTWLKKKSLYFSFQYFSPAYFLKWDIQLYLKTHQMLDWVNDKPLGSF